MFTGAGGELASVCLFHLQNVSDLAVRVIECFVQNIGGALCGSQFLKKQEDGKPQCFPALRAQCGIATGIHWFWKPRTNVGFSPRSGTLSEINTHSCSCRG